MRKKCPVCRNRLEDDGTCRFASSHENILKMRAEASRGRRPPVKSAEELKDMRDKAARLKRAMPKPGRKAVNPAKSEAAKRSAAAKPRVRGRFVKRKKGNGQ